MHSEDDGRFTNNCGHTIRASQTTKDAKGNETKSLLVHQVMHRERPKLKKIEADECARSNELITLDRRPTIGNT